MRSLLWAVLALLAAPAGAASCKGFYAGLPAHSGLSPLDACVSWRLSTGKPVRLARVADRPECAEIEGLLYVRIYRCAFDDLALWSEVRK